MNKSIFLIMVTAMLAILFVACQHGDSMSSPMQSENPDNGTTQFLAKVGRGMIWADCLAYGTIGTPATFKGTNGPFDQLYGGVDFKDGIGAISESKPGDQDYNGGRWHLNVLKAGVDPLIYSDACSVEDLDLDDFESTDMYFECPLLPRKN